MCVCIYVLNTPFVAQIKATSKTKKIRLQEKDCYFMDKREQVQMTSDDVTRESLIAIAYSAPEKDNGLEHSSTNLYSKNEVNGINNDGDDEKYRSKLISISYSKSDDPKTPPVLPGDLKG